MCQAGTLTLPGAHNRITCLLAGLFPSGGSGCPASPCPCSHRRCPGLQRLACHGPADGQAQRVALARRAVEGRCKTAIPVLLLVPSRFYPAKPPPLCLCSSPPLQAPRAGCLAAFLFPGQALDLAELCAALAWAVPRLSLKAFCLGPSTICDALGAAPSSSASVRADDVP